MTLNDLKERILFFLRIHSYDYEVEQIYQYERNGENIEIIWPENQLRKWLSEHMEGPYRLEWAYFNPIVIQTAHQRDLVLIELIDMNLLQ
jgi:hypothetical protein